MSDQLSIHENFSSEESISLRVSGVYVPMQVMHNTKRLHFIKPEFRPSLELSEIVSVLPSASVRPDDNYANVDNHFVEPFYCNYDDLHNLGREWWIFEQIGPALIVPVEGYARDVVYPESDDSLSDVSASEFLQDRKFSAGAQVKRIGCRCNMSKCLRLHCRCFKDLEYCAKNCKCTDCYNNFKNEEARAFVIQKTKEINPNAFNSKIICVENDMSKINCEGCSCKKGCDRNYCECFKNNVGCSALCKCQSCKNKQLPIKAEKIQKIVPPVSRSKNKIVFDSVLDTKDSGENEKKEPKPTHKLSFPSIAESFESKKNANDESCKKELVARVISYQNYKKVKLEMLPF